MPYSKQQHKLLSGSLNLLAPLDQTPEGDAIAISNFRADTTGSIRTRPGHASIYGIAAHSHLSGVGHRYNGVGTALYRDGVSVDTGYDGAVLGLAAFQKNAWIMNKGKQRKDNGTTVSLWGIAAPSGAPAVAVASELTTTVENFESAASWSGITSGLTLTDEAAIKKQGSNSLQGDVSANETYSFQKTGLSLNLNSVGGQTGAGTDKFRVYFQCNRPKAIQSITLIVAVESSATFDTDYYRCRIRKKYWKALTGWVLLEIDREQQTDDNLADQLSALFFERVGATAGRDWSTVTGLKIEVEVVNATADDPVTFYLDQWEVFGSAVGSIEGPNVVYYYTYVNADGHESNPSPASTPVSFNRRRASVTVTASADTQVTGINIYRGGGILDDIYLVNAAPEANTNHTYTDTASDRTITVRGVKLEDDNDLPPAAAGILNSAFFQRLIVFNSATYPNRFWWSKQFKPYAFAGSALTASGDWADVGDSGYAILTATHHDSILHLWKADSMWMVIGDPGDTGGGLTKSAVQFGTLGPQSVCRIGNYDAVVANDGIYLCSGDGARKISQKIDPVFKGQTVTLASGITKPPMTATAGNRAKAALGYFGGVLWFSYCESGQSANNVTLKVDIDAGFNVGDWKEDTRGFAVFYDEAGTFLGGNAAGLFQIESGTSDAGSTIPIVYERGYTDFGIPDALKTVEDIVIECDTGGATLTLAAYKDNGTALTLSGPTITTTAGTRTKFTFQLDTEGKGNQIFNLSIRLTGNSNTSNPVIIYGLWAHYYPEARNASSYDTDESPLGSNYVKEIRRVRADIDNANDATLRVYTDIPLNVMSEREAVAITAAAGRRMFEATLATRWKGLLGRGVIDGSAFRAYNLLYEVRDIGEYVRANRVWNSDEITYSKPRGVRAIKIELENTATVDVTFQSNLPGNALANRYTSPDITGTGARRTVIIPLDAEYYGDMFKLTLSSASDWILYGVELESREIGTYISGSQGQQWDSGVLDFGSERVKLYKELELDVISSATMTLALLTDQPGGALAARLSSGNTIASTASARATAKVRLPDGIKGRLFELRASTAATDFIVEAARVWLKLIGQPNASPWQWVDLPLIKSAQGIYQWQPLPVVPTQSGVWRWVGFGADAAT